MIPSPLLDVRSMVHTHLPALPAFSTAVASAALTATAPAADQRREADAMRRDAAATAAGTAARPTTGAVIRAEVAPASIATPRQVPPSSRPTILCEPVPGTLTRVIEVCEEGPELTRVADVGEREHLG